MRSRSATNPSGFLSLEDVLQHDLFPELDTDLRAGRHVSTVENDKFALLEDAFDLLEPFYRRYGLELTRSDGFMYLVPVGDRARRRQLTAGEMLSGQVLALLKLDPSTVQTGGLVSRTQMLEMLVSITGEEQLVSALNPRRKRRDERIEHDTVRQEIDRALRTLESLGFIQLVEDDHIRLQDALARFLDPVRGSGDPKEALQRLVDKGSVVLGDDDSEEAA